jgi:HAD superfamily hydrolase (TIGR01509 family)
MAIRGVLLDIDGTLVVSNDTHARAWSDALAEFGHPVPFQRIRPLIGMGGDKLLPKVTGIDADSSEGKKISDRRGEIFDDEFLPHLQPCRGSHALLAELARRGFRMAAASSAKKDELKKLLEICGADDHVEAATSSDDADNSKPDPDIVLAALKRLKLAPEEAVLIGDTPYDVESARRAGIAVIAFRCGGWDDSHLKADETYDNPQDLLDRLNQSPLLAKSPDR